MLNSIKYLGENNTNSPSNSKLKKKNKTTPSEKWKMPFSNSFFENSVIDIAKPASLVAQTVKHLPAM